jgi:hypothetical protein
MYSVVSTFWYWFFTYSTSWSALAPVVHGEYILGDPAELHDDVVCVGFVDYLKVLHTRLHHNRKGINKYKKGGAQKRRIENGI